MKISNINSTNGIIMSESTIVIRIRSKPPPSILWTKTPKDQNRIVSPLDHYEQPKIDYMTKKTRQILLSSLLGSSLSGIYSSPGWERQTQFFIKMKLDQTRIILFDKNQYVWNPDDDVQDEET